MIDLPERSQEVLTLAVLITAAFTVAFWFGRRQGRRERW